jgi:ribosomal-protein-alanine N-acetyltransferase
MTGELFPKIRPFGFGDIAEILEIEEQAFPKTPYSKETLLFYAHRYPDTFVVVESDDEILGYIIFDLSGHIHSTAVRTGNRKKGLGSKLFMHALAHTEKGLWLEVRTRNDGAIAFYKRMGMHIIGKIPRYYENDDALVMVLKRNH